MDYDEGYSIRDIDNDWLNSNMDCETDSDFDSDIDDYNYNYNNSIVRTNLYKYLVTFLFKSFSLWMTAGNLGINS